MKKKKRSFMDTLRLRSRMVREWRDASPRIVGAVRDVLPTSRVYVLGSVVRGDFTGGSDVDVLIISEEIPERVSERAKVKVGLEEKARLPSYHPFEFHLVKPEEAEPYLRRAGKDLLRLH